MKIYIYSFFILIYELKLVLCNQTFNILENKPPKTEIGTIDIVLKGTLYLKSTNIKINDYFSVNSTNGKLYSLVMFDREYIDIFKFAVKSDANQVTVIVKVEDVNDNPPVLSDNDYVIDITENDNVKDIALHCFSLTDKDEKLQYQESEVSIKGNDYGIFYIERSINKPEQCEFFLFSRFFSFDRENKSQYALNILAANVDNKSLSTEMSLTVNIKDVNDNKPYIENGGHIAVSVPENITINSSLVVVSATDKDEGENAKLTFQISNDNKYFNIDAVSGNIYIKRSLDYEIAKEVSFTVFVADNGNQVQLTSTATVRVSISDVNDNDPKFSNDIFWFNITENSQNFNKSLALVDNDSDIVNKRSTFMISPNLNFNITSVDGLTPYLVLIEPLDREKVDDLNLTVTATNIASPFLSTSSTIIIEVVDVNDNYPIFNRNFTVIHLDNSTAPGSLLYTGHATDADRTTEFNSITYLISDSNNGYVKLKNAHGKFNIYASNNLDFTLEMTKVLTIQASDNGITHFANFTLTLFIHKLNLYAPQFENENYTFNVKENMNPPIKLGRIVALDKDENDKDSISYNILFSHSQFVYDTKTNFLVVNKSLDREDISLYKLLIIAIDSGKNKLTGSTDVYVHVIDVNDNTPKFTPDLYEQSISEHTDVGKTILIVKADDPDEGLNGKISYKFDENQSQSTRAFTINSELGFINLVQKLDRESTVNYVLTVLAVDSAAVTAERKTGSCTVSITVTDENDNGPKWPKSVVDLEVEENTYSLTNYEFKATDSDSSANSKISYELKKSTYSGYFNLTQNSSIATENNVAYLSLKEPIDYDTLPSSSKYIKLEIVATNHIYLSILIVRIKVLDQNDNAPVIKPFRIYIYTYQDMTYLASIGKIPASDVDTNSVLKYVLINNGNQPPINVDKHGNVFINYSNLGDISRNYSITVEVTDGIHKTASKAALHHIHISKDELKYSVKMELELIESTNLQSPNLIELINNDVEDLRSNLSKLLSNSVLHDIIIFNVQNVVSADRKVLEVSFLRKNNEMQTDRQQLSAWMDIVAGKLSRFKQYAVNIKHLEDICANEPCAYDAVCQPTYQYANLSSLSLSNAIILQNTLLTTAEATCICPIKIGGKPYPHKCINFNPCFSNKCIENRSICIPIDSNQYYCHCIDPSIHFGSYCQLQRHPTNKTLITVVAPFHPQCVAGTVVVISHNPPDINYICRDCPPYQNAGSESISSDCKLTALLFGSSSSTPSFVSFNLQHQRHHLKIEMKFLTWVPDCVLFFRGTISRKNNDFIALYLSGGELIYQLNLGGNRTQQISLKKRNGFSDGRRYTVTAMFSQNTMWLWYSNDERNHCDYAVDDQQLSDLTEMSRGNIWPCSSKKVLQQCSHDNFDSLKYTCFRALDTTSFTYIGGVPESYQSRFNLSKFEGCISKFKYNDELVNLNDAVHRQGYILSGCECNQQECGETNCYLNLKSHKCICDRNYRDPCNIPQTTSKVYNMKAQDVIAWSSNNETNISTFLMEFYVLFDYKLKEKSRIFKLHLSPLNYTVELIFFAQSVYQSQSLILMLSLDQNTTSYTPIFVTFYDSLWHKLNVRLSTQDFKLTIDQISVSLSLQPHSLPSFTVKEIEFGGSTFQGLLIPTYPKVVFVRRPPAGNRQQSPFKMLSESKCSNTSQGLMCNCVSGRTLRKGGCVTKCSTNPCVSVDKFAKCSLDSNKIMSDVHCQCSTNTGYYGNYCEWKLPVPPCPKGWWGTKYCQPCLCQPSEGFMEQCNNATGKCLCALDHFNRLGRCLPCGCHPRGSLSLACAAGVCQCKNQYVKGSNCARCADNMAEINTDGVCQVIRGYCPQSTEYGIDWPRIRYGKTIVRDCSLTDTIGKASRKCRANSGWDEPIVDECIDSKLNDIMLNRGVYLTNKNVLSKTKASNLANDLATILDARLNINFSTVSSSYTRANIAMEDLYLYPLEVTVSANFLSLLIDYEISLEVPVIVSVQRFSQSIFKLISYLLQYSPKSWLRLQQPSFSLSNRTQLQLVQFNFLLHKVEQYLNYLSSIIPSKFDVNINAKSSNFDFFIHKHKWNQNVTLQKPVNFDDLATSNNVLQITIQSSQLNRTDNNNNSKELGLSVLLLNKMALNFTYGSFHISSPLILLESHHLKINNMSQGTVTLQIPLKNISSINQSANFSCYLLQDRYPMNNTNMGLQWYSNSCRTVHPPSNFSVVCQCNHLSLFTFFYKVDQRIETSLPISVEVYVLCAIAIAIFIIATILLGVMMLLLGYKRIAVAFNFSINTLLFLITYVAGVNKIDNKSSCLVTGILLHLTALFASSFSFILLLHTYRRIVIKNNAADYGSVINYLFIGYIPSFVVVSITTVSTHLSYVNSKRCWLPLDHPSAWSILLPLSCLVLATLIMYFIVLYHYCYQMKHDDTSQKKSVGNHVQQLPPCNKPGIMKKYFSNNYNKNPTAIVQPVIPEENNSKLFYGIIYFIKNEKFPIDEHYVQLKTIIPLLILPFVPLTFLSFYVGSAVKSSQAYTSSAFMITASVMAIVISILFVMVTAVWDNIVICGWISLYYKKAKSISDKLKSRYFEKIEISKNTEQPKCNANEPINIQNSYMTSSSSHITSIPRYYIRDFSRTNFGFEDESESSSSSDSV